MDIEFRKITEFPRGTLAALLRDGYSFEPKFERDWHDQWQEFDDFFYDNPHIAESSGFMTVLEGSLSDFIRICGAENALRNYCKINLEFSGGRNEYI